MPGGILLSWSCPPELMFKTIGLFRSCLFLFAYKEYRSGTNTSLGLHCHLVNTLRLFWQCYLFSFLFFFTAYPVQNPPKYLPPIDQHSSHRGTNTTGTSTGAASQSREYLTWWCHHFGCGVRLLSVPGIRSRYDDWVYACINVRWI